MKKDKIINAILIISFVFYAIFTVWNILFKYVSPLELFSDNRFFYRSINIIPFNDLIEGNYLKLDVWGNIILFVPFGIYLKVWQQKKWCQFVITGVTASVCLEILQYVFSIGATDITDIIYNTLGFLLGGIIYSIINRILKNPTKTKMIISVLAGIIMLIVMILIFFLVILN